jgi:hypothetical protein
MIMLKPDHHADYLLLGWLPLTLITCRKWLSWRHSWGTTLGSRALRRRRK